ncbi:N-acetylmuramidase family protein [Albibacillus kandeliae]|uniref:N-acetylmuramidase family protein n=1 Tax=Albibacillus kandeliae TaxID=2174228 RepID=UPI000D6923C6|nr:N-acetylmuramidase family protein [Albibacillus kandeliae]
MNFSGKAARLEDVDLPRIGAEIGVGEDEIHAILEVESRGRGFDPLGRPVMLFEPHIFWRQLGAGAKRDEAARKGVAYPRWGERRYPKDSYPRLSIALGIDEPAALRSASWGLGQIMGFNHGLCGYETARTMVQDMMESEAAQLSAMVRFIVSAGLDDELRRHDWAGFARVYNGPSYAKHGYDVRLARAFAKWRAIPDTPWKRGRAVETLHAAA